MAYLHSQNITHQDLKPSNILLDNQLNPYISDFSALNITNTKKKGPEIAGTSIYTAPEICKGQDYTKSSNIYSFSMIIYEIITGKKPFQGMNPFQIVAKNVQGERPELNSSIPETYKILIQKCWSSDPNERPTFDQIVEFLDKKDPSILEADQIETMPKSETKEESESIKKSETKEESESIKKSKTKEESESIKKSKTKEESESIKKSETKKESESGLSKKSELSLSKQESKSNEEYSDSGLSSQDKRKVRFSCCCCVDDDSDGKCFKKKRFIKDCGITYSYSEHGDIYDDDSDDEECKIDANKMYEKHVSSTYSCQYDSENNISSESKSSNVNDESCSKKQFINDLKNKMIDLDLFVKQQKIGEGGFGCVYKIIDKTNKSQEYVAKISKKKHLKFNE